MPSLLPGFTTHLHLYFTYIIVLDVSSKANSTMPFSWGTPGIEVKPPTAQAADLPIPKRFSDLEFTPQGIYDLRQMLGALPGYPGEFTSHQACFEAADLAWFVSGCSTDGRHVIPADEFHPAMERMYSQKFGPESCRLLKERVQKLVFDSVHS